MLSVTILTPCRNEQENVRVLVDRVAGIMAAVGDVTYEHWFIDNASSDGTVAELRALAAKNPRVKAIVNQRNFGHVRSPFHGLLQAKGDAVIVLAADLQDPPRS